MKKTQGARGRENQHAYPALSDKSVYRDQALTHRIDRKEKTFESDSPKQGWSLRCNKAWSRDFFTVESQSRFGYGPDVSLSTRDYDALRARGFKLESFRQRAGYHAECRTGIDKKLNFFNAPFWTGQTTFYVEQPHIKNLLNNAVIVAQLTYKANALQLPLPPTDRVNSPTAKQIGLTIPPNCWRERIG